MVDQPFWVKAFAVLLLLFGLVWLKDLREDALAEQQATVHLIELLLASPDDNAPARLAAALTPGQFRHVKLDMSAPEPMSPGTPAQPQGLLPWLGLSMEGAQAHRIRVGTQDLWISPDPDSEFREKLSTSVQVLIMLVLFCGICLGLTWFAVDHALSPVKELNAGLVRLAAGSGGFYRYFRTKDEALAAVVRREIDQLEARQAADWKAVL